jgi:hypothetical protein
MTWVGRQSGNCRSRDFSGGGRSTPVETTAMNERANLTEQLGELISR